jgi:hypothetical protein
MKQMVQRRRRAGTPTRSCPEGAERHVKRAIVGYHLDDAGDWVADLECGHGQHVRHDPPWQLRPWVLTPEGRAAFLGVELECRLCDEHGR